MQGLLDLIHRDSLWTALIATVVGGLIVLLIWEWHQRVKRRFVLVLLLASILAIWMLPYLFGHPHPHPPPPPPEPSPGPPLVYEKLLGRKRTDVQVNEALTNLGVHEEKPLPVGKEFCFREQGVDFRFDAGDILDTIALFSGFSGDIHSACDEKLLPLGLRFKQTRTEAQKSIDDHLGRHLKPELGVGDCDKYELESYRLYLLYGELDGAKKIREVQLVRPESFLQHQAR